MTIEHGYEPKLHTLMGFHLTQQEFIVLSFKGRHPYFGYIFGPVAGEKKIHNVRDTRYESRKLLSVVSTTNIVQGLLTVYRQLR
jgi:hypothetical protein